MVVVEGRVQGVFFRESCRREATKAGVTGWIRNRPDGMVEAVFEGEQAAVGAMVGWCHQGPRGAVVTGVRVLDEQVRGDAGFVVIA